MFTNVPTAEKTGVNKNHLHPVETMEKLGVEEVDDSYLEHTFLNTLMYFFIIGFAEDDTEKTGPHNVHVK